MQPESKFLDADYLDQGTTIRRHVQMIATRHIGKESNDWERQAVLGLNADAQPDYGISESDRSRLLEKLGAFITGLGKTKAARALGTTPMRLNQLLAGAPDRAMIRLAQSIAERLPHAIQLHAKLDHERQMELRRLRAQVSADGLRATARRLGMDPSNLRRQLRSAQRFWSWPAL